MAWLWFPDWAWGLPLLVLIIVAHVSAIALTAKVLGLTGGSGARDTSHFVLLVALAALATTVYLALEAVAWGVLYRWIGALPTLRVAMLYSLNAMTAYGHADVYLDDPWRLLGAIEAVNGLILFGLTTAFLYAAIHEAWPLRRG